MYVLSLLITFEHGSGNEEQKTGLRGCSHLYTAIHVRRVPSLTRLQVG